MSTPTLRWTALLATCTAVVAVLGGCSESGPVAPASEGAVGPVPSVAAAVASPARSFHLDGGAALVHQTLAPDAGPPLFGRSLFGGRCSVPSDFMIGFTIEGRATHMGRTTGSAEHCSQVDFLTGESAITDGRATLVAANGDEVWTEYRREAGGPEIHTFVGGTGRFASAWGEATAFPECDREAGTCVLTMMGTLGYAGADASGS